MGWRGKEGGGGAYVRQAGTYHLRSQQVLQDILVLDGGRSVVLPVLLDLLVRVLLPEERHLDPVYPVDLARVYTYVQHNVYLRTLTYPVICHKRHTLY